MDDFDSQTPTFFSPKQPQEDTPATDPLGDYLVAIGGTDPGRIAEVEDNGVTIGRDPGREVVFADTELSRLHARVTRAPNGVMNVPHTPSMWMRMRRMITFGPRADTTGETRRACTHRSAHPRSRRLPEADTSAMQPALVASDEALRAFCTSTRGASIVALDTEFLRVRTYYPELCLLQVAAAGHIA